MLGDKTVELFLDLLGLGEDETVSLIDCIDLVLLRTHEIPILLDVLAKIIHSLSKMSDFLVYLVTLVNLATCFVLSLI